jgi:hypothetical protein
MSIITRPESARMDFRGDIEYRDKKGRRVTIGWSELMPNSDAALHAMHRYAQCEHKPHLAPDQYIIKSLRIHYKEIDGARRDLVEQIEIPAGTNPDVRKRKVKAEPHPDFPFVNEDLLSQSQRALQAASAEPNKNPQ